MRTMQIFRSPSQIIFEVAEPDHRPMISQAVRGQTFLHNGAVCMLSEVSGYQALKDFKRFKECSEALDKAIWVVNLQTGRTFVVNDGPIEWVKVTMTVEGQ